MQRQSFYSFLFLFLSLFCLITIINADVYSSQGWVRLKSSIPWSAIKTQPSNKLNMAAIYNNVTIKALNASTPTSPFYLITIQDYLMTHNNQPAYTGAEFIVNFTMPLINETFHPQSIIKQYSPCKASFLQSPEPFYFNVLYSFPNYPPPIALQYLMQTNVADTSLALNKIEAIPTYLNTYYSIANPQGKQYTLNVESASKGIPLLNQRFREIRFSVDCEDQFGVLLKDTTTDSISIDMPTKKGILLITLYAVDPLPDKPDYKIWISGGGGDGGDGGDGDSDDTDLAWYWILLICVGGVVVGAFVMAILGTLGYFAFCRKSGYEHL